MGRKPEAGLANKATMRALSWLGSTPEGPVRQVRIASHAEATQPHCSPTRELARNGTNARRRQERERDVQGPSNPRPPYRRPSRGPKT
eukprot:342620-Pyramimonas_sp.AAC.1